MLFMSLLRAKGFTSPQIITCYIRASDPLKNRNLKINRPNHLHFHVSIVNFVFTRESETSIIIIIYVSGTYIHVPPTKLKVYNMTHVHSDCI